MEQPTQNPRNAMLYHWLIWQAQTYGGDRIYNKVLRDCERDYCNPPDREVYDGWWVTCHTCIGHQECEFDGDFYNTNGDCLMDK